MALRSQWKTLIIAFALPYLQFLGCSLIGLGLGAISDSDKADDYSIARAAIDSVEMGSTVTIIKRDGATVKGDYSGVRKRPAKMYSEGYDLALAKSDYDGYLPKLGEAAAIVTSQGSFEGLYLGIDRNFVLMQLKNEQDTIGVYLDSVEVVGGGDGQQLRGPELRQLVYDATVLSKSYILMWADQQTVAIPYEAVDSVAVDVSKSGALTGFLVGLGIDAGVIACAAIEYSDQKKSCGKGVTVGL